MANGSHNNLEDDLVSAREDYTITITVLATPWLPPGPAVLVRRLAEGDWDRPPAAAAGTGPVHRGGGGHYHLTEHNIQRR